MCKPKTNLDPAVIGNEAILHNRCDTINICRMEPKSLEQTTLVKIGIALWMRNEMEHFMAKQSNGIIAMEKALPLLRKAVYEFPLTQILKENLMNMIERIGYDLYVFLTKSYIKDNFHVSKIRWTPEGTVDDLNTLRVCFQDVNEYTRSHFKSACAVFDELSVKKIWSDLSEEERASCRRDSQNILYASFWIHECDNNLENFLQDWGSLIIGFERSKSLNANMFWHSIAINNRNAVHYFFKKLSGSDLEPRAMNNSDLERDWLLKVVTSSHPNGLKFILNFLEKPIVNENLREIIVGKMSRGFYRHFLEFVLRQVNIFGDLHFNLFRYVLFFASLRFANVVRDNLDFYALTLLGKGRFEKFDFLVHLDPKNILHRQLSYRLKHSSGLAIFATILMNKHAELLRGFLSWLAVSEEDKMFFHHSLTAIIEGNQYEI